MNSTLLTLKVNNSCFTKSEIAKKLGLTRQSFYNKLNGKREFKASEIQILAQVLDLSEVEKNNIFFADFVDIYGYKADSLVEKGDNP